MERLVEDDKLKLTSAETWKNLTPKILSQAKIESIHNSRLRSALEEKSPESEGVHLQCIYNVHIRVVYTSEFKYSCSQLSH